MNFKRDRSPEHGFEPSASFVPLQLQVEELATLGKGFYRRGLQVCRFEIGLKSATTAPC